MRWDWSLLRRLLRQEADLEMDGHLDLLKAGAHGLLESAVLLEPAS
jgi:hypothetical protein